MPLVRRKIEENSDMNIVYTLQNEWWKSYFTCGFLTQYMLYLKLF